MIGANEMPVIRTAQAKAPVVVQASEWSCNIEEATELGTQDEGVKFPLYFGDTSKDAAWLGIDCA
eukprot:1401956-Rhodomonas_salina.2